VGKTEEDASPKVFEFCPHCGRQLSPWEKVLLNVDRALMCGTVGIASTSIPRPMHRNRKGGNEILQLV
jgi:hypothetical protein